MRRIALIALALAAGAWLVLAGTGAAEGDSYKVRAIFDSGGFLVEGEEVRIAGARVGSISEVDVTGVDEAAHEDGSPDPGKAVVVMDITDPAFQDFRDDASCLIRPQSLLGERFVECTATQPRAPGTEPPPELEVVPDGEPGEGQHFLPVENSGKAIDLDLVNNIMREPYPDRFRLILNDLGAALAARGEDLAAIVERSNPALREVNEVLAILAEQNRELAQLAADGDTILQPLAREREHIGNFINAANTAARATAERRVELEEGISRLPAFLRELRLTMPKLEAFAESAAPTVADLGAAAPALTRASEALAPFSDAATGALTSLGDAAEESQGDIVASDDMLVALRNLSRDAQSPAANLARLLTSLRRANGFENAGLLLYNTVGISNGFDSLGHFMRALLPLNNCVDYEQIPELSCTAEFIPPIQTRAVAREQKLALKALLRSTRSREGGRPSAERAGATSPERADAGAVADVVPGIAQILQDASLLPVPTEPAPEQPDPEPEPGTEPEAQAVEPKSSAEPGMRDVRAVLDFLVGPRGAER